MTDRDQCLVPEGGYARGMFPPAWREAAVGWQRGLVAGGRSETARAVCRVVLLRFAHAFPEGPDVIGDDVVEYFALHEDWKPSTRRCCRRVLADFYAWAAVQGIAADPMGAVPAIRVQVGVPRGRGRQEPRLVPVTDDLRAGLALLVGDRDD